MNQKHRAAKPKEDASIWTIPKWEEVKLCADAAIMHWQCPKGALWNASEEVGNGAHKLGEDLGGDLWVAKFVSDSNHEWHGYPVRPIKHDIPPAVAIKAWAGAGRISVADARRMQKGQL